jgi:hypothetical protein
MVGTLFLVDPDSRTSWSHDWSPFLARDESGNITETIDTQQWSISPMNSGSPETPVLSNAASDVVFVEGLLAGHVYKLKERATTSNGVIMDQTIVIRADDT